MSLKKINKNPTSSKAGVFFMAGNYLVITYCTENHMDLGKKECNCQSVGLCPKQKDKNHKYKG